MTSYWWIDDVPTGDVHVQGLLDSDKHVYNSKLLSNYLCTELCGTCVPIISII